MNDLAQVRGSEVVGADSARIEIVEGLRGIAALSVAWYHFTNGHGLLQEGWLKSTGSHGWLGVEIFFVISGFIIPFSMHRGGFRFPGHVGTFLLKRIVRLDPPYLVAGALAMTLAYLSAALPGYAGQQPEFTVPQILLHLGYLNTFFGYPWLIPVFWSLAIEFQFYICTALAFPLLIHSSPFVRLAAFAAMGISGYLLPDPLFVFHYLGLFALGVATFWKFVGISSLRTYVPFAIAATLVTADAHGAPVAVVGLATAAAIAFVRMPHFGFFTFFGSVSYSLYLLHTIVGGRVVNLAVRYAESVNSTLTHFAILMAAMASSVVAAYLMYVAVEQPARKWASKFGYLQTKP
jgi:peptidoglycan/LPS O-acetylase OafA/YrhL